MVYHGIDRIKNFVKIWGARSTEEVDVKPKTSEAKPEDVFGCTENSEVEGTPNLHKNFDATDTFLPEAPIFRGLSQFWHLVIFHLSLFTDIFGRQTEENLEK